MTERAVLKAAVFSVCSAVALSAAFPAYASEPSATSAEIAEEVLGYESGVSEAEAALKETEDMISETEAALAALRSGISDTEAALSAYECGMAERIRYFYENSRTGATEALLSGDFPAAVSRIEMQKALYDYDKEQLAEYASLAEELSREEAELEEAEEALSALKAEREEALSALEDALSGAEDAYADAVAREEAAGVIAGTPDEVAAKVYSVLKYIGWTDEWIAGALGNIEYECGFDYSAVETVYDEKFSWGEKKQAADDADYLMSEVDPSYRYRSVLRCGIGLIQWTDTASGARGNTGLREYAAENGTVWYDLDLQLRYLTHADGDGKRAERILDREKYGRYSGGTASDAARWWAYYVEGSDRKVARKASAAEEWLKRIEAGELTYDEEYAAGILE